MKPFPILPIWLMALICIGMVAVILVQFKKIAVLNIISRILIVALLFAINLRVMTPTGMAYTVTNNLDILFAVDTTISMVAEDCDGTRLDAVKRDAEYIIDQLNGARFSVISFNDKARQIIPYTADGRFAAETVQTLSVPDEFYAKGSSLNTALDELIKSLKRSAGDQGRTRILFFISDGEITNGDSLKSFNDAGKYLAGGAVLGYGTEKGGKMKVFDKYAPEGEDPEQYIKDKSAWPWEPALSVIDQENLQKIAGDMGLKYIHMSERSNIDGTLADVRRIIEESFDGVEEYAHEDTYFWFVIPLCLLLGFEFVGCRRNLR